jgi:hypothetical protein
MVKNQEDCGVLTQHASLSHEEFTYVAELVQVFDRARCNWVSLILSPDINKLVHSRKLKAKNENAVYQWTQTQEMMLKGLTDVQASIKIIKSLLRIRKKRTKAILWIAMKMADRAWMEQPPAVGEAAACVVSEQDWLASVIGWTSDAEIREFKLPASSRVHENDPADGRPWALVKVQALVDAAMSPPMYKSCDCGNCGST